MSFKLAIVGATGAVGREMITVLRQRGFPVASLRLLASPRSAGTAMRFGSEDLAVEMLSDESFEGVDFALFSAGASVSREWAPRAVASGATVIDNSSAFRMDADVPLVVPEINADALRGHRGVIAVPNCSTIIMVMAVAPLHRRNPVRRLVACTYQAISGAGARAMQELRDQTAAVLRGGAAVTHALPHVCAFNVFSHNSAIDDAGHNGEETKMIRETHKILGDDSIEIAATCVRVPVLRAHSEALHITFERPIDPDEARGILAVAPGLKLVDDRTGNHFPMPIEADGRDDVFVGRIRRDTSRGDGRGLAMFISGDQLRKGAALNAVQIAERLIAQ
jgi:aspartate-semialdehyde dehydrogenase